MYSRLIKVIALTLALTACASTSLTAGKQDFDSQNYSGAIAKMQPLADKGNADAQYAVGYMLYYGKGAAVNRKQGVAWIDKAADQGLPEAVQAQAMLAKGVQANPLET